MYFNVIQLSTIRCSPLKQNSLGSVWKGSLLYINSKCSQFEILDIIQVWHFDPTSCFEFDLLQTRQSDRRSPAPPDKMSSRHVSLTGLVAQLNCPELHLIFS